MEFQLNYFKSWKMLLWKSCTQYPSKFGKLSSGHRTGKCQFSFQSQRKAMPKHAPVLWPPNVKSWLIGKDPDAGKDWRQVEKGVAEDEMVGWHHRFNGHKFEQTPGDGEGQRSLVCCSPRGRKESDVIRLNDWTTIATAWELVYLYPLAVSTPGRASELWRRCIRLSGRRAALSQAPEMQITVWSRPRCTLLRFLCCGGGVGGGVCSCVHSCSPGWAQPLENEDTLSLEQQQKSLPAPGSPFRGHTFLEQHQMLSIMEPSLCFGC